MRELDANSGKTIASYALVLGIGYILAAVTVLLVEDEIFLGIIPHIAVLLVIAATYLMSVKYLQAHKKGGLSFIMGGLLLSILIGGLYLLMAAADYLMFALGESDSFGLSIEVVTVTILMIISVPLLKMFWNHTKGIAW